MSSIVLDPRRRTASKRDRTLCSQLLGYTEKAGPEQIERLLDKKKKKRPYTVASASSLKLPK